MHDNEGIDPQQHKSIERTLSANKKRRTEL
jgi:hypothetical protein